MYRLLPMLTLTLSLLLAIGGCGRQSDTHDPPDAQSPQSEGVDSTQPDETATEVMEEPVTPPPDDSGTAVPESSATPPQTDTGEAPICTPEWFVWVHEQVLARHDGDMAELYPAGLPEVGSAEWFLAVDKLTGGDGAHGPDGGSAEWCSMVQQRLGSPAQ
ncbi:hypothetical protein [Microbulbifer taiwanensis]|uniref:Secreted protein n=1 Tax=Microbulbifer taiwanensis TaxID=986746 RepID=A0ABW1YR92_9GAMM|nr:hypothetical protein [Microbulbifer taiwanensis]